MRLIHECTLLNVLVESRGSDYGTSVTFRRSCHSHGAFTASVTVVAMTRATVPSVATSVGPAIATHGCTTATATTIFYRHLHVNCQGNPRQSTANATAFDGHCHGNIPTPSAMAMRGNCHGNFHGHLSTVICKFTAFATAIQGNCHDKRRDATRTTGRHVKWNVCQTLAVCITKNQSKGRTWYVC